jgi:hypothetical protein
MLSNIEQAGKRLYRVLTSFRPPIPDWSALIAHDRWLWENALAEAEGGKRILIATSTGRHQSLISVESILGVALTLRGADVHLLLCDEFLPACMEATVHHTREVNFVKQGPKPSLCDSCFRTGRKMYEPLGLPLHLYGEWVTPQEQAQARQLAGSISFNEIEHHRLDDLAVGEHALAGALRYFVRGTLEEEPNAEPVLRRYFQASLLTAYALRRLIDVFNYDVIVFHHGIYVPQGIIGEVARRKGVRVVNWNPAYRKKCFIFTHEDTYHHQLMKEPTATWKTMRWTPDHERQIMDYLKSRWQGTQDWIWFHEDPQENVATIAEEFNIDLSKPAIGALTNVMWDAQLHYPTNAFDSMLDWMLQTIDYFCQRSEMQLIIRIHPAEIRGTLHSCQPMLDEIHKAFPDLPSNIIVIPPESQVSTYAVMMKCDSVIIYGTKTGVELTSQGIPVIVAGEAWIRGKGLTIDVDSIPGYFDILDRLPFNERMNEDQVRESRKYAYHFFFRRMIPLSFMEPHSGWPPYQARLTGLRNLLPGEEPGLDVICEGILNGAEFVYREEEMLHRQAVDG